MLMHLVFSIQAAISE